MQKYKRPLLFILDSFKWHKKLFYLFFLWKIVEGIFYVILPVILKLEMDQLVEQNEQLFWFIQLSSFNIFIVILTVIFLIKLLENLLKSLISLFEFDYVKIYENYFLETIYNNLQDMQAGIFLNSRNKRVVSDVIGTASSLWGMIREFLWKVVSNIFVVIWITTVLALINIWIFVIIIVSTVILYFIDILENKYKSRFDFEDKYELDEKNWILTSQMQKNINYLISSGGYNFVLDFFKKYNNDIRNRTLLQQKRSFILSVFHFITENISEILVKLVVWIGIFFWTTSVGTMTMSILYISRLQELWAFIRISKFQLNDFKDNLLKLDLFIDLTTVKNKKTQVVKSFDSIIFKDLEFSYPNFAELELKYLEITENRIRNYSYKWEYEKDKLHLIEEARKEAKKENPIILKNINIEFESWKIYWLVGRNWAWKTTITSLLLNFFDTYKWSILVNQKEARDIKKQNFISNISVINQEPYIIEWFTIRENLMLWVEKEVSENKIIKLLEKFNLKDKIYKNRQALDTKLWYDVDFSWWEKQLIVLIRTILQDKNILIMDEWTNQLDAENEMKVMNELLKNRKNKIIIFITHRMTTIKKADTIYCLEDWKIKNYWNHEDLINRNNIYSDFYKKQVW